MSCIQQEVVWRVLLEQQEWGARVLPGEQGCWSGDGDLTIDK
jgi:hypothetical protein